MSLIRRARRPLLIFHTLAGDLLMAVPTLRFLTERYGADIPLVCGIEPEHQLIFRQVGFTNLHPSEFLAGKTRHAESLVLSNYWDFNVESVLPAAAGCDLLINLTETDGPDFSSLANRLQMPVIGFHPNADLRVAWFGGPAHSFERYFRVAQALDPSSYLTNYSYFPHRADADAIRNAVREEVGPGRIVVIHADTKIDKMWALDRWAEWLKLLWAAEPNTNVLLLGYPAIPVERYAVDSRLHDCRDLPLTANYEIAAMADLFVGIDSCMIHAADLCRVATVGLFTHDFPPHHVGLRFADGECLTGAKQLTDISATAVWEAYRRVRDRQCRRERAPQGSCGRQVSAVTT